MKIFAKWLLFSLLLYSSTGLGLHFYYSAYPTKTFVLLDASFGMKAKWSVARSRLDSLTNNASYHEFALATGKNRVHSWSDSLDIGTTLTYGPRKITRYLSTTDIDEIEQADQRIVITNDSKSAQQFEDKGWIAIRL
jgi:hypothetical protein